MKAVLFFVVTFVASQLAAQISFSEKKGKYIVTTESGKVLLKGLDSVIIFESPHYQNYFATVSDGYYSLWKLSDSDKPISVLKGDYSSINVEKYRGKELVIYDFYHNQRIISHDGSISDLILKKHLGGGQNNSGKVALCNSNSNITPYIYSKIHQPEGFHKSWFVAYTDSGNLVINEYGDLLIPQAMDAYYPSVYHDSLLIAKKGDLWSVIDFSGTFTLPPTRLVNPQGVFQFDQKSFANLANTIALYTENGKLGVIDFYGNVLVPPVNDDIQYADGGYFEEPNGLTSYALRPDSTKHEWMILDTNYRLKFTIGEDQLISVEGINALFMTDNRLHIYNLETGKETDFFSRGYPEQFIVSANRMSGLANRSGDFILPFEHHGISEYLDSNNVHYYILTNTTSAAIFNATGNCISKDIQCDRIEQIYTTEHLYFELKKGNLFGIGHLFDGTFTVLFSIEYDNPNFNSWIYDNSPAYAMKDGQEYWLFLDGSVKIKK